jgi:hypothetical protein
MEQETDPINDITKAVMVASGLVVVCTRCSTLWKLYVTFQYSGVPAATFSQRLTS